MPLPIYGDGRERRNPFIDEDGLCRARDEVSLSSSNHRLLANKSNWAQEKRAAEIQIEMEGGGHEFHVRFRTLLSLMCSQR
jgi:hypothetical protein